MAQNRDAALLDQLLLVSRKFEDAVPQSVWDQMVHLDHARLDKMLLTPDDRAIHSHPFSAELKFTLEAAEVFRLRDRVFEEGVFEGIALFTAEESKGRFGGVDGEVVCYFMHRYLHAYRQFIIGNERDSQKRMLSLRIPDSLFNELNDRADREGVVRTDFVLLAIRQALSRPSDIRRIRGNGGGVRALSRGNSLT